jgi:hypothetical protein
MKLFNRAIDLWVGPNASVTRMTGLRAIFTVEKSLEKNPNKLDLKIYNLSKTTRGLLQSKGVAIYLLAGYTGELAQIFYGHARTIDHVQEGPDMVTRIQCGDGELAFQERFSESFAPGAKLTEVLLAVAKKMKIDTGNIEKKLAPGAFRNGFSEFAHGYAASDRAVDVLDRLLTAAGFTWSVQDGVLQVLKANESLPDEVIKLTPESGLIGSPAHGSPTTTHPQDPPALKVKSLLRPAFNPGRRVQIESKSLKATYRIEKLKHTGDTAGTDWYSELEFKEANSDGSADAEPE